MTNSNKKPTDQLLHLLHVRMEANSLAIYSLAHISVAFIQTAKLLLHHSIPQVILYHLAAS
jgi:hypothetical protein